jgi:predicted nucleic acid-binding protein
MSGKIFLDTNILVYAHDASEGAKHARAQAVMDDLWTSRQGVLSTQVLQEFAFNLRRRISPPLSTAETREWLVEYMRWEVVTNTPNSILNALEIEEHYQVSFWDAMILQAAASAGADTLYSEDLSDGQTYGTVRVKNPLK